MVIKTNRSEYENDFFDIVNLFSGAKGEPDAVYSVDFSCAEESGGAGSPATCAEGVCIENPSEIEPHSGRVGITARAKIMSGEFFDSAEFCYPDERIYGGSAEEKRLLKRKAKNLLYKVLSTAFGEKQAWGSLTGIRPSFLAYEYLDALGRGLTGGGKPVFSSLSKKAGADSGMSLGSAEKGLTEHLENAFFVSPENAALLAEIIENQKDIYDRGVKNAAIYINIPVCPTRCDYCSFFSSLSSDAGLEKYLELLRKEIALAFELVRKNDMLLRSVYIGGGTPICLPEKGLDGLLCAVSEGLSGVPSGRLFRKKTADGGERCKSVSGSADRFEFTLEAGRPDEITAEKLGILKNHGVTRISVNPQTFLDKTLEKIGRRHKAADVYRAFEAARLFDFSVNADLIAGLPGETIGDFSFSLSETLKLSPENITVHTLCFKRGSEVQTKNTALRDSGVREMIARSRERLCGAGYAPYYLYRQKNALGNNENTGFTLRGEACVHNIDSIEECASIIACGAGAVSKRIFPPDLLKGATENDAPVGRAPAHGAEQERTLYSRIERAGTPKFLSDYIARFPEILSKKRVFWG